MIALGTKALALPVPLVLIYQSTNLIGYIYPTVPSIANQLKKTFAFKEEKVSSAL
jgi:hypothetical protein